MERINAVTFAPFCARGTFEKEETRQSLKLMKEKTGANYVIFAPNGMQKTAFSEEIDYRTDRNVTDEELIAMIGYAKELGLNVALKPTANCADGTWRAHINFFDEDVVCEPKWGNWFASYRAFQEHYARLAQQCGVDLFIAGCEMVQTERRHRVLTVTDLFTIEQDQTTGGYNTYSMVDSALAGALELVNMEDVPVFTIATGHGEMLTSDNMASFISMLEDQNFEVQEIDLLTESIPEGTQVLMLPTPTTDYSEAEVDKLREYLNNTTNPEALTLLATSNPTQGSMPNYEAFLEEWGIRVEEGVVAETNTDRMALADAYGVLVDPSEDYLSGNTYDRLVSYYSAPITKLFDANNGISTYDLWTTSDSAYVVTEDTTEEQAADPDTSSQTVASVSSKYVQVDGSSVTRSLVMFGSSYVFLDTFMSNAFSDGSFVTDLTLYLTGNDGSNVTVLTERVQTNEMDVTATRSTMDMWGIIFSAVIPVAILACGLVIFLKRRHL